MQKEKSRLNQSPNFEKYSIDFQLILNHIGDVVYCLAPDSDNNFYFKYANQTFSNKSGMKPEDVIGKRIQDVMPEIDRITEKKKFKEAISNKKIIGWRMSTELPSGKKVGFVQVIPEFDANDKCLNVIVIIKDLTSQEITEKSNSEAKERWKFALEGAGDGVWDWNTQNNEVFFSKQWKKMLGYEEHEIGTTLSEWDKRVHPDDKEKVFADLNKHFEGKTEFYENEHRVLCKDGTYKWILDRGKVMQKAEDGKPLRVIGMHTDISGRKKTEQLIKESENRFSQIMQSVNLVSIILEADATLSYCNDYFLKITGYLKDEVIGKNWFDLFIPHKIAEHIREVFLGAISNNSFVPFMENEIKTKNDELKTIAWNNTILRNEKGEIKGIACLGEDISLRKKAEKEIIKLNVELEEKIKDRTSDLEEKIKEIERMNKLFVGRELRMKELKDKIIELEEKLKVEN